jgi:hypothetical protein
MDFAGMTLEPGAIGRRMADRWGVRDQEHSSDWLHAVSDHPTVGMSSPAPRTKRCVFGIWPAVDARQLPDSSGLRVGARQQFVFDVAVAGFLVAAAVRWQVGLRRCDLLISR